MKKPFALIALFALITFALHPAPSRAAGADESPATTKPSTLYYMDRQSVLGTSPRQWVFVIVIPGGYAAVTTPAKLQECVQATVPANATLQWAPSDLLTGDEPDVDLKSLEALCKKLNIHFVLIPGG